MQRHRRIYLLGGSFNPPGLHHERVIDGLQSLCKDDDLIVIIPCGMRPDKERTNDVDPGHRAAMAQLAFAHLDRVELDLSDLERPEFTRTWDLDARYRERYPDADIWHVVGTDLVDGGASRQSEIHRWHRGMELFLNRSFVVVTRETPVVSSIDFPRDHCILDLLVRGSSSMIRSLRGERQDITHLMTPAVNRYIERWHLYTGRSTLDLVDWRPSGRAIIVPMQPDPENPNPQREARARELVALAER